MLGSQLTNFNAMDNGLSFAVTMFWFSIKRIIIPRELALPQNVAEGIATTDSLTTDYNSLS